MTCNSLRLRHALVLGGLCLLLLAGPAFSQELIKAFTGGKAPDHSQTSPRATMSKFLKAMYDVNNGKTARIEDAVSCFNLQDVANTERSEKGSELAFLLFKVIDAQVFDAEEIPDDEKGPDFVWLDTKEGKVVLHHYDDGLWRFNSRTIQDLPDLNDAVSKGVELTAAQAMVDPRLRSARAVVQTFIDGMGKGDADGLADAIATLELPEGASGSVTAKLLYQVITRFPRVDIHSISNEPDYVPYIYKPLEKNYPLVVARNEDSQEWHFKAEPLGEELLEEYQRILSLAVRWGNQDAHADIMSLTLRLWVYEHFPFLLDRLLLIENWQLVGLFVIILTGFTISRLLCMMLTLVLRKWFQREAIVLNKRLEREFVRPVRIALMAWVWLLGLSPLGLPDTAFNVLKQAAQAVSAAAAFWAIYKLIDVLGSFLEKRATRTDTRFDDLLVPLVTRSLKVFVIAFGAVFVAQTLEFPIASLLAGLGLGGLAFALAAKDTVSNIFGSLTVLLDRPFQIGDWVIIDGAEGGVESVGIRSTRIRTFYNSLITVPNSKLINAVVDNMGARRYRRYKTLISITYDTPPGKIDAFCEGIRRLILKHPYTRKDYFHVYLNQFAASSLDILLYCFHEVPDWSTELRERHRLCLDIIRLAQSLGVEFAFPTQTLYMQRDEAQGTGTPEAPQQADEAFKLGRAEADRIVATHLGDEIPGPVSFEIGSEDDE